MPRPVVLLHGFTGRSQSWDKVRSALSSDVEVIAPNLIGHSGIVPDEPPLDFEQYVERLAIRLKLLGAEDAHLVGYSMGGRVALSLLINHPELFSSASLVGVHPGLAKKREHAERIKLEHEWIQLLREKGIGAFVEYWEQYPLFESQKNLDFETLMNQKILRLSQNEQGLIRAIEVLGLSSMPNYELKASDIEVPVEILVGEYDQKFQGRGELLATMIPQGEMLIIEATGHNVVLERPEVVAQQINSWSSSANH